MLLHHRSIMVVLLAIGIAGCQTTSSSRRELGTLLSPGNGGFSDRSEPALPRSMPPVNTGTVVGGVAGSEIGRALDPADQQMATRAEFIALETVAAGGQHQWRGGRAAIEGSIAPGEPYQINRSQCRDYTHTIIVDGRSRLWRGTACRQPGGSWRAINS